MRALTLGWWVNRALDVALVAALFFALSLHCACGGDATLPPVPDGAVLAPPVPGHNPRAVQAPPELGHPPDAGTDR